MPRDVLSVEARTGRAAQETRHRQQEGRACLRLSNNRLHSHTFDFVECDGVASTVIELGGAGALVRGHTLRMFEDAASVHVGRNACGPERMTADTHLETYRNGASPDHAGGIDTVRPCP